MATPTVKRTTELTELEWERLEQDAQRLAVRSWRSMLRGIARGELVVSSAPGTTGVRLPKEPKKRTLTRADAGGDYTIERDPDAQ